MMKRCRPFVNSLCGAMLIAATSAQAAHPLISDDAGTTGKGGALLEITGQYDHNSADGVTDKGYELGLTLTYGLSENLDLVVSAPYQSWSSRSDDADGKSSESGLGDSYLALKWRFYEENGTSFAIKPGVSFATGDEDRGLGAGKTGYELFFIGTKEVEPFAVHLNLGYIRANNDAFERENLWHVSLAGEMELSKNLKLVANIGAARTVDTESSTHPAFILGGFIYSLNEKVDIDFGIKAGLSHAEPDYSLLAGLAFSF